MHLPYDKFSRQLPRIQNYVTQKKYYQNSSYTGEKKEFINHFTLQNWFTKLNERERKQHQLENCPPCESKNLSHSVLHTSGSENAKNIVTQTSELADKFSQLKSPNADQFIKILEPIMKENFQTSMKSAVSKHYNLDEKIPTGEKQMQKQTAREKCKESFQRTRTTLMHFLQVESLSDN
jgi:hypothetical protein